MTKDHEPMDREELEHVIESAYQDMRGVIDGKKGYRLRHKELAERLELIITKREKALLESIYRERREQIFIDGIRRSVIATGVVLSAINNLEKGNKL